MERRVDLALADGNETTQLPRLLELTAENPFAQSLWSRLLTVLDLVAFGRSAGAGIRRKYRRRIADELGGDPGPQLQEVHRRPAVAPPRPLRRRWCRVVPRQLPAAARR